MAWPDVDIPTTNLDATSDSPSAAIADLKLMAETVNDIMAARGMPDGIAAVDTNGFLSIDHLKPADLLTALTSVDGSGSLLDADTVDGRQATAFALVNGLQPFAMLTSDVTNGLGVTITGALTTTAQAALELSTDSSSTPAAGLGTGIRFKVRSGSAPALAAGLYARWVDPTVGSLDSALTVELLTGNVLSEQLRIEDRHLEFTQITAPGTSPASTKWWMYFTSSGLFYKNSSDTVVGPLTAGDNVVDHDDLTNRTNDGAHTQYLLVDGSRALSGTLLLDVNPIRFTQTTDGAVPTPPSGSFHVYMKSDGGLYKKDSAAVSTALGGSGTTDHALLTNRGNADAHSQYLLKQPGSMTDATINAAQDDVDFRILSENEDHLFFVDASIDAVGINTASPSSGRLQVTGGDQTGLYVTSDVIGIVAITTGAGFATAISAQANADATALNATRSVAATSGTYPCVKIVDSHASTTADLLQLASSGTGDLLRCSYAGSALLRIRTTGLVINDAQGTVFDFTVKGDTLAQLFFCDASTDTVNVGGAGTTGRLNVFGGSSHVGIYAESTAAGLAAINGNGNAAAAYGISGTASSGVAVSGRVATYIAGYFDRTGNAGAVTDPVMFINAAGASDTGLALKVRHDGSGRVAQFGTNANATLYGIENDGALTAFMLSGDPSTPAAGFLKLYAKSDGVYCILPDTTVIGPFDVGGAAGDHGALTGLTDDDHLQYLPVLWSSSVRSGGATAATIKFTDATWTGGLSVERADASLSSAVTALTLAHTVTGTAAANLGVSLRYTLEDSAGNQDDAALWSVLWTTATSGAEYARAELQLRVNASLSTQFKWLEGRQEFAQRGSNPANPASGFWGLYFKSDGLYSIDESGSVTGPYGTGAGSPGGSNTYVQFNDSSAFGGTADLTFVKTATAQELFLNGRLRITQTGTRIPMRVTGASVNNVHWLLESVVTGGAFSAVLGTADNALNQETVLSTLAGTTLRVVSGGDWANVVMTLDAPSGEQRLYKSPGSAVYFGLKPSASQASAFTLTLPAAAPAANGYLLSSTTAGVTSWIAASGIGGSPVANDTARYNGSAWVPSSLLINDTSSIGVTGGALYVQGAAVGAGTLSIRSTAITVTNPSGATVVVSTPQIGIVLSVTARVTTTLGAVTSWDLGATGLTQAWGAAFTSGTGAKAVKPMIVTTTGSTQIIMTANGANFDGTGVVKFALCMLVPTAPTS